jgi:hypothetical protein
MIALEWPGALAARPSILSRRGQPGTLWGPCESAGLVAGRSNASQVGGERGRRGAGPWLRRQSDGGAPTAPVSLSPPREHISLRLAGRPKVRGADQLASSAPYRSGDGTPPPPATTTTPTPKALTKRLTAKWNCCRRRWRWPDWPPGLARGPRNAPPNKSGARVRPAHSDFNHFAPANFIHLQASLWLTAAGFGSVLAGVCLL